LDCYSDNKELMIPKKNIALLGLAAFAMGGDFGYSNPSVIKPEKRPLQPIIRSGLKRFDYGENHVYALNQKNADRKARKLGYIQ
jgi:hypothetical protein